MDNPGLNRITLGENGQITINPDPAPTPTEAYPLAMTRDCMYGRAGEWADLIQGPDGPAYVSILAVAASHKIVCSGATPRIFVALLGGVRLGKSTCINRALEIVPHEATSIKREFPASLPGLAKILYDPGKDDPKVGDPGYTKPHVLFALDELEPILCACQTPGSGRALEGGLRTLWGATDTGSADKRGNGKISAHINMIGPLPVENSREFEKHFGVGSRGGLHDRFIFAPFPNFRWKWNHINWSAPIVKTWKDTGDTIEVEALDDAPMKPESDSRPAPFKAFIQVPHYVNDMLQDWIDAAPMSASDPDKQTDRSRLGEQAVRVAVITASCNGDDHVTVEGMQAALRFAEWQERVISVYQPAESDNMYAKFMIAVEKACRKALKDKPSTYYLNWRDLCNSQSFYRDYPQQVQSMKSLLVRDNLITPKITKDEDGEKSVDYNFFRWHDAK